jgi:1-acyl-sn-glycerol-3-phosphate acyltransferase
LGKPVTPAAISYSLHGNGNPGQEIAYWGEHTLFPHLLNLLSRPGFEARIAFGHCRPPESDRKREAARLHGEVSELLKQMK